ncbi:MAG: DNA cytosine methyltransferase [Planctomycetaceae bacterium]
MKIISTFSGCGGSSLGYKQAGGKVLLAVEYDDHAAACYRANFPDTKLYHGDIANLSGEEVLQLSSLKVGELDILDSSPPCQKIFDCWQASLPRYQKPTLP